jgi:hypothetical protein
MTPKTYARIQSGVVAEILHTDAAISTLFHSGIVWVDITGETKIVEGWRFDGARFAPAVAPAVAVGMPTMPQILAELALLKAEIAAIKTGAPPPIKNS